ncbi:MAG: DegQ family serine endoprotease [Undibacterium sp.]|nr:DegQ family serine endoprotease [Undibacterium sp.]
MRLAKFFPVEKHVSILLSSLIIGASVFVGVSYLSNSGDANAQVSAVAVPQAPLLVTGLPDFTVLVEKTSPAVVNIRTTQKIVQNPMDVYGDQDELFRRFFGIPNPSPQNPKNRRQVPKQQEQEVPRGVGSGFIISSDGFVLTNNHVVEGASEVFVKLTDKREFKAKVIGADKRTDIAVLKIEASKLPKLAIGDSDKIKAGEWVIAIGSPFDLDNTVTSGIISSKSRETGDLLPLIQTDVAVNPGNSGGPLLNLRGEVIGINSQIYSRSGGYMGISFAIPIDEAMRVVDQLKSKGSVSRGLLGVSIDDVNEETAQALGLSKAQGASIVNVSPGGPAEKAGVQAGDIIIKVNGVAIEKRTDLPRLIGALKPGNKATITVWRKGSTKELTAVIGEAEADNVAVKKVKEKQEKNNNALGIQVSDLTEAQKRQMPNGAGVMIEHVEGVAAASGLQPGDIILAMSNVDIVDAKQFDAMVSKLDSKKPVALLVRRDDSSRYLVIRPTAK